MNNEEAIEILKDIYPSRKQIVTGEYPDVAEALDIALSALRAQEEREKKCEWCNKYMPDSERHIYAYCPICGKNLEVTK